MRILFLSGEYPPLPGGVGDYTRRLAQALTVAGHEALVLTISGGRWQLWRVTLAERDEPLPSPTGRASWRMLAAPRLAALVHDLHPDWCHIQYQTGAYQMRIGVNVLPLLLRQTATAITYHDLLPPYLFPKAGSVREWVTLLPARTARAVIVTNPEDEAALQAVGVHPQMIPIGANIEPQLRPPEQSTDWRAQLDVRQAEVLIGYFGLLSPSKGIDLLLDLLDQQPHWRLVIIGGAATMPTDQSYAATIQRRIAITGLTNRVYITGYIAANEVSACFAACDVVALPFRDGASLRRGSLLAALAHGCAVVTTPPATPATAALLHGAVQWAAPQPAAFGAAITSLLTDPEAGARLRTTARAVARQFDWKNIAAAHIRLYQSWNS